MDPRDRKTLKALVLELRRIFEGRYDGMGRRQPGDLARRLAEIGVRRDRAPVPAAALAHLCAEDRRTRAVVDAYLAVRRSDGITTADSVDEFIRETAYTWANRLLALRCMEARGLIDEVILQKEAYGGRSLAHHRLAVRMPEIAIN